MKAWTHLRRILILIHLSAVALTIAHLNEKFNNRIYHGLNDYYSAFTYTNRCFGFFAPEVYGDLNYEITMYHHDSTKSMYRFDNPNFESRVRLYSLMGHFGEDGDSIQMNLFARSWGLLAFNNNPDVNEIDINVYRNIIPSMKEWNNGIRLSKDSFYFTHLSIE